jgi:glycosyltransferase involved in cell wall biosynthesis
MSRPLRILELRSVRGTGGGPEKTILQGAAQADPGRFAVTVCYLRDRRDPAFAVGAAARRLGVDYVEVEERHSFDCRVWPTLRRLVRERGIDLVHAHDYKTDLLAYLLARAEGVVPLATVHNWSGVSCRERCYYWFDKRLLAKFPRLIAVSAAVRAELLRAGADANRIHTVPNGIDSDLYRRDSRRVPDARAALGIVTGEFAIGFVGRLEREKRIDILLDAFGRVRRPGLQLLIAGDGNCRAELQDQAERLGLGDSCRFLGHYHDIIGLHHALDLFVQSSDTEGTSNALLEAMALETPVVATAVGGTGELVQHEVHGLLVPPGDPAALVTAIGQVLDDRAAADRRAAATRARVEQDLSFAARMQAVEAIYEDLVACRSGFQPDPVRLET